MFVLVLTLDSSSNLITGALSSS